MNKTYFTPITSEVQYAGCTIICGTTIPDEDPASIGGKGGEPTSPARKLYV